MSVFTRNVGISCISVLLYLLFVLAGTSLCLAGLSLVGCLTVWKGLAFPLDLRAAIALAGIGAGALLLGLGLYGAARRAFPD